MTVAQLVMELKRFSPDLPIICYKPGQGYGRHDCKLTQVFVSEYDEKNSPKRVYIAKPPDRPTTAALELL